MKLTFHYERARDVWCLLNKGASSINSPTPTKVYEELVHEKGISPTENDTGLFIDSYLLKNKIDVSAFAETSQKQWEVISASYHERAEEIFGVALPNNIAAYITINDRCPYSIEDNMFYVSTAYPHAVTKTAMHELWHFYTWYKYGIKWEEKLGAEKYNETKEALTVLLNAECKDLLPEGVTDKGYPQHKELREKILEIWSKNRSMDALWEAIV